MFDCENVSRETDTRLPILSPLFLPLFLSFEWEYFFFALKPTTDVSFSLDVAFTSPDLQQEKPLSLSFFLQVSVRFCQHDSRYSRTPSQITRDSDLRDSN